MFIAGWWRKMFHSLKGTLTFCCGWRKPEGPRPPQVLHQGHSWAPQQSRAFAHCQEKEWPFPVLIKASACEAGTCDVSTQRHSFETQGEWVLKGVTEGLSQCQPTHVTRYPRKFILAHGFAGFSSWLLVPVIFEPWWGTTPWQKQITEEISHLGVARK